MLEEIKKLKKVELHLHLDGSASVLTLSRLSGKSVEAVKKLMVAQEKCHDLSDYLTKFDFPISYMQTKDNLSLIARELVDYLEGQNVIYAEIRFAPMFHTNNGLTYDEVVEAVLEGLNSNKYVKTNLILCMMRGANKEFNLKTLEVASKFLNNGVCAIDLAGAEDKYPLNNYLDLFEIANDRGIPFTIHAGETSDYSEIDMAIKVGAKRIGHGIRADNSIDVQNLIIKKEVLLEICPTSNVQTNSIDRYEEHPIFNFYKKGIKLCVNTDNVTVSNITLCDEYVKLYEVFDFTLNDFRKMNLDAINKSFLSDYEKDDLIGKISL